MYGSKTLCCGNLSLFFTPQALKFFDSFPQITCCCWLLRNAFSLSAYAFCLSKASQKIREEVVCSQIQSSSGKTKGWLRHTKKDGGIHHPGFSNTFIIFIQLNNSRSISTSSGTTVSVQSCGLQVLRLEIRTVHQLEHWVVSDIVEAKTLLWRWRHCTACGVTSPLASSRLYVTNPELST